MITDIHKQKTGKTNYRNGPQRTEMEASIMITMMITLLIIRVITFRITTISMYMITLWTEGQTKYHMNTALCVASRGKTHECSGHSVLIGE